MAAQEITAHLLDRYFSTKTMFDIDTNMGCGEEARQVLQASQTQPPIRHALSSLRAIREDLEISGTVPTSVVEQTPRHDYGLQQYCMALGGLASNMNLSSPGFSESPRLTLLCCQVFISIEQARGNFATMAQHIIQGLGIMREYRPRPCLVPSTAAARKFVVVPARKSQLPFLDVFIVKLFAAPCKFAEKEPPCPATATVDTRTGGATDNLKPVESCRFRTIVPDKRAELTGIAASTLEFLDKVSRVECAEDALSLLSAKASLLGSLESWLVDLELLQGVHAKAHHMQAPGTSSEPLSMSFARLFHQVLKLVLLGALDTMSSAAELRPENERLLDIATQIGERVKAYYRTHGGTGIVFGPGLSERRHV